MFIIAVYVDDIILAGESSTRIQELIQKIDEKFEIKDMGKLHHFLGVKIVYMKENKIWIGQQTYTTEILKKFQMENSKPVSTPTEHGTKLAKTSTESRLVDQEKYQSAVGSLLYLSTRTRPDIAYAVSSVARYSSQPTLQHWIAVKRIFRYLNGTLDYGLVYEPCDKVMCGFSDADWAGDYDDRKSTTGYVFEMNGDAISWRSKKQSCVALSTAEAEYIALSSTAQETAWLQRLVNEICKKRVETVVIHEDNQSAIHIAKNPQFHGRIKHIDIKYH